MNEKRPCPGPLEGVIVLDLTRALAGPFASMILGDLGAEVIKVEPPAGAGVEFTSRTPGILNQTYKGEDLQFLNSHRNKKSITINLKALKGRQIVYDLVGGIDVVLDNFRAGVMQKLKLDYETLKKINRRIISCSITGFGLTGPYRDRPSFDSITQALSGVMGITGPQGGAPCKAGPMIGDLTGPVFAVSAICAALYRAEKTGQGQQIDISLLDCLTAIVSYHAALYLIAGQIQGPIGGRDRNNPFHGIYKAKDGYFVMAAHRDQFWRNMCKAIGREDLIEDPRFAANAARVKNAEVAWELLDAVFETKTAAEWVDILISHDVPSAPVNRIDQMVQDPQLLSRNMVVSLEHPEEGGIRLLGNPIKMSSIEEQRYSYPPAFGQHTEQVLSKLLGYSKDEIEALRQEGVV